MLPDFLEEAIEVESHVAADDNGVGLFGNEVHFLHGNSVDFVVAIKAFDVLSVA